MNIFVRTHATYGSSAVEVEEVLKDLRTEMSRLISLADDAPFHKLRIIFQNESCRYEQEAILALSISIVLDIAFDSDDLTKLCQDLRRRLRRKYTTEKLRLKIVAIKSSVGASVDRDEWCM
jgi:hypothetical protein